MEEMSASSLGALSKIRSPAIAIESTAAVTEGASLECPVLRCSEVEESVVPSSHGEV